MGSALRLMAVLPLIQGFVHLDMARAQRGMRFGPFVKITLGAEFIGEVDYEGAVFRKYRLETK